MNVSFVYYCYKCDKCTISTSYETKGVCEKCKTPVDERPLCINANSVLQNIFNGETDFLEWVKVVHTKKLIAYEQSKLIRR